MDQEQNDMSYVYKTTKRRPIINDLRPFISLNNNKKKKHKRLFFYDIRDKCLIHRINYERS